MDLQRRQFRASRSARRRRRPSQTTPVFLSAGVASSANVDIIINLAPTCLPAGQTGALRRSSTATTPAGAPAVPASKPIASWDRSPPHITSQRTSIGSASAIIPDDWPKSAQWKKPTRRTRSSGESTSVGNPMAGSRRAVTGRAYCIVIPPPNVTGTLHMGHAFQHTLMDALTRYHRMRGDDTLWQPGTDHAGIATQMVVERQLNAQGKKRTDLAPRGVRRARLEVEGAVRRHDHGADAPAGRLASTGRATASPWIRGFARGRRSFRAPARRRADLSRQAAGQLGSRAAHRAFRSRSGESEEEEGHLWHLRYPLEDGSGHVVVATTRPETMLGDTAVAVNPEDERYQRSDRQEAPSAADRPADPDHRGLPTSIAAFGSGAVKITPAHDFNDYEIGLRHNLPHDQHLHARARRSTRTCRSDSSGLDRFEARKRVVAELEAAGLLATHRQTQVDGAARRPQRRRARALLTDQWYVKIAPLAEPAISAVESKAARASCRRTGRRPISSGCATSRTGASAASSGGAIAFPRGTTTHGNVYRRPRRSRGAQEAYRSAATWLAQDDGRARHLVLLRAVAVLDAGLAGEDAGARQVLSRRACWSPASTSSSSGSPG